jgi:DNA-3-methyladenine glycosylase
LVRGTIIPREFYERDTAIVASELLGKRLSLETLDGMLEGVLVETEAYYGLDDPASRAYKGVKNYNLLMWGEPGRAFIYNVHQYWMLNIVAHRDGGVGAVLIRAIEPTQGVAVMMRNRLVKDISQLTSGPGKLTVAMDIDKRFQGLDVTRPDSEIKILKNGGNCDVGTSKRIGVRMDLNEELRFYIKGNRYVSR